MKKQQLDHVLRAAGRITGESRFLVIGSQSLHGKYPDVPDDIAFSAEVDLIAGDNVDRTEWLNAIGQDSPFHESFGAPGRQCGYRLTAVVFRLIDCDPFERLSVDGLRRGVSETLLHPANRN